MPDHWYWNIASGPICVKICGQGDRLNDKSRKGKTCSLSSSSTPLWYELKILLLTLTSSSFDYILILPRSLGSIFPYSLTSASSLLIIYYDLINYILYKRGSYFSIGGLSYFMIGLTNVSTSCLSSHFIYLFDYLMIFVILFHFLSIFSWWLFTWVAVRDPIFLEMVE